MRIGIVGVGVVGGALSYGFNRLGHTVIEHDIKYPESRVEEVADTAVTFVCVPTPRNHQDGSCDTRAVEIVVADLVAMKYRGLIVIKSTVAPGTTDMIDSRYVQTPARPRLAFCPEFLREKATYSDFFENHEVLISGVYSAVDAAIIEEAHEPLPKAMVRLTPLEAELAKYFCNTLNAARIVFASQFFEICQSLGADYAAIKNAVARRSSVGNHYLDCNHNFRKFGGACLPKDLSAIAALVRDCKIDAPLFEFLLRENERIAS